MACASKGRFLQTGRLVNGGLGKYWLHTGALHTHTQNEWEWDREAFLSCNQYLLAVSKEQLPLEKISGERCTYENNEFLLTQEME